MPWDEERLKQHLKTGEPASVYVLYGEENYLVSQYADKLRRRALDDAGLEEFNFHAFDGLRCRFEEVEDAADALPLMAERTCVIVRDYDVAAHADTHERLLAMVESPNTSCTLIFTYAAVTPSPTKNARWKTFLAAAEKTGAVVKLSHRTPEEVVRLLVAGATRRGCTMRPDAARLLLEWSGNDLRLLLGELDKLAALADGGEIDRALVERAATRNLESRVFDLSRAILAGQYTRACEILQGLFAQKEDPIMINGVLASAWADLYRAKVAAAAGKPVGAVTEVYAGYRGKEFRLKNAMRDASRLSMATLRAGLDILVKADRRLKFTAVDNRVVLEETTVRLIVLIRQGA